MVHGGEHEKDVGGEGMNTSHYNYVSKLSEWGSPSCVQTSLQVGGLVERHLVEQEPLS